MSKKTNVEKDQRSKIWACIIYPDSAPDNFMEIIRSLMLEGFLSPLHEDQPEDEVELRKPHYHFQMYFPTNKSYDQVKVITDQLHATRPERLNNARAYARYLCHLDQPDKQRYDIADVIEFGGRNYIEVINTSSDRYKVIAEIMDFCDENQDLIHNSFALLMRYCRKWDKKEWFQALCDNSAYIIKEYLESLAWTEKNNFI